MRIEHEGVFTKAYDEEGNTIFGKYKNGKFELLNANYFGHDYTFTYGNWKRYGRIMATKSFVAWVNHMRQMAENKISTASKAI